jgi:hypothetical protein
MILSILIMLSICAGGFTLTYVIEPQKTFLWRAAAGVVIGSALFGTLTFLLSMLGGLSSVTVAVALILTVSPAALFLDGRRRAVFIGDWAKAKGKLQGASTPKLLRFAYYAGFLVLFVFFFDRAMIETDQGIFTGGSNNLGDLPFHLGAIFSFTEGANFPPQNPNFAGAKFSYPFIADLITAAFVKLGVGVRDGMFVQNVAWAFSLLVLVENFVVQLTGEKFAAKLAPPILFFSGGLGFLWFFSDYAGQSKGLFELLNALPKDYTIGDEFRWGNSLTTLFLTQRSLLLGMPITLVVLGFLWRIFTDEEPAGENRTFTLGLVPPMVAGLIAGLLPLIHLHSLVVLFVVTGFLLLMRLERWRTFAVFGVGVCITALPAILWSVSGSASRAAEFIDWHFGFDSRDSNVIWFWIKNTGALIPLVVIGAYLYMLPQRRKDAQEGKTRKGKGKIRIEDGPRSIRRPNLILFYIPFVFLFVLSNVTKLAPWEWDNIKVLIYWFVGSIPLVVIALVWMWRKSSSWRVVAGIAFAVLIAAGSIDVWRTVSRQIDYRVFEPDAVVIARRIKAVTPPRSLFLNAPTYNTAVVLTGRQSLMRYTGHLSSHGIDFGERESHVKRIYQGAPDAVGLMAKYGIEYVLISPEERALVAPNEAFFARFPVIAESGQYRVHKVR